MCVQFILICLVVSQAKFLLSIKLHVQAENSHAYYLLDAEVCWKTIRDHSISLLPMDIRGSSSTKEEKWASWAKLWLTLVQSMIQASLKDWNLTSKSHKQTQSIRCLEVPKKICLRTQLNVSNMTLFHSVHKCAMNLTRACFQGCTLYNIGSEIRNCLHNINQWI